MADVKPKKMGRGPELPQLSTAAVTRKLSIKKMLRLDLIQEIKEERKQNKLMAMRENKLKEDFKRNLDVVSKQNQNLTIERNSLLHQLQQEMYKSEALRQELLEYQESHQSIVDSVVEHNTIRVQEMSLQIEDLTNQCRVYLDEKHYLTEKLKQINEENTCAICLSPWEAQGDHRIVSLPCGHLFGKKCIRDCLAQKSDCPLCKQKVQSGEIRYIFGCGILPIRKQPSQAVPCALAAQPAPRQQLQPAPPPEQLDSRPVQQASTAQPDPRPVQQAPSAQPARRPRQQSRRPVQPAPALVQPAPSAPTLAQPAPSVPTLVQPAVLIQPASVSHNTAQNAQQPILRMPDVFEQQAAELLGYAWHIAPILHHAVQGAQQPILQQAAQAASRRLQQASALQSAQRQQLLPTLPVQPALFPYQSFVRHALPYSYIGNTQELWPDYAYRYRLPLFY